MQKQVAVNDMGASPGFSERWEVDHLCNLYGLSRATARNIVQDHAGDRSRMEREAERLAKYERLH